MRSLEWTPSLTARSETTQMHGRYARNREVTREKHLSLLRKRDDSIRVRARKPRSPLVTTFDGA